MSRPETTLSLSNLTEKLICPTGDTRIYWAKEVTFDYATLNPVRVDYMRFKPLNNTVSGTEKGDFNYYVMPKDVFDAVREEIPYQVGVHCPADPWNTLRSVKQAHRKDRTRPLSEMLLMMFRSAARERRKTSLSSATKECF